MVMKRLRSAVTGSQLNYIMSLTDISQVMLWGAVARAIWIRDLLSECSVLEKPHRDSVESCITNQTAQLTGSHSALLTAEYRSCDTEGNREHPQVLGEEEPSLRGQARGDSEESHIATPPPHGCMGALATPPDAEAASPSFQQGSLKLRTRRCY